MLKIKLLEKVFWDGVECLGLLVFLLILLPIMLPVDAILLFIMGLKKIFEKIYETLHLEAEKSF